MKEIFNSAQRFSIRKYSIGAASVLLGAVFLAQGQVASADQVTDSAETPQVEVTSSAITETVPETSSPSVVEVVEKPIASTVEIPKIVTPQAEENLPAKATETPASEVAEKVAEETPTKATQGYAAAQTEKPTSSVSADTTRRRAPKNTRKAPEAFQNTARGYAKAEVNPETSTSSASDNQPTVGTDRTATAGQTGFFNARSGLIGDNYPWKHGNTHVDQDNLGYPVRQCTSFVAYRLSTTNKVTNNISYLGHAKDWGYTAVGRGARVDKTPAIGSVAWFKPGDGWSHPVYGHVSWVAGIRGDKVLIEEYNRTTPLGYGTYEMPISMVTGFIHFKDLTGGQVQATSHTNQTSSNQSVVQSGTYTFTQRAGIRAEANMTSPELAYYSAGQSVNYDSKVTKNGYEWISYLSFAGNRRYIAIKEVAKPVVAAPKRETVKPVITSPTSNNKTPQRQQPNIPSSGTYRFTVRSAVRPEARIASAGLAHYSPGQTVNYDRVLQAEGRTWLSYIAGSGNRRYIAIN